MNIDADYLHKKWSCINFYDGGYTQIATDHPLQWYVGYKGIDQKTLLLISESEMELLPSSKSISVSKGKRSDGKWTLSFNLLRPDQESVFETLCADLLSYSQSAVSSKESLKKIFTRFKQWNRLLEHQRKSLMDECSRRGLLGELLYLMQLIDSGYGVLRAVQGWVGPEGADQDFVFTDGWHEIKTVGLSADTISISSLEQLNNPNAGEVVVMRIDKCAPEHQGAFSLAEAVQMAFSKISSSSEASLILESKLNKYGYIDLPEYAEQKYLYYDKQSYSADSSFPRLTADLVPSQIVSVQYAISLPGIEPWKRLEG